MTDLRLACVALALITPLLHAADSPRASGPAADPAPPPAARPPCPAGWTDFENPLVGVQAHVPSNYWVRLHGGVLLAVEQVNEPTTMAFVLPFRPRAGTDATAIARQFAKFVAQSEPRFEAEVLGQASPDRALARFTSVAAGRPVQGKYQALLTAGGSMALVIGVMAPRDQLESELPRLRQIAQGFGFQSPRGRWRDYVSPAGGFTLRHPEGWPIESSDGRSGKDNVDWVVRDPRQPLSRAFQWCPRYCSPQLLQDPLHVLRGYQAAQFGSPEQTVIAALSQISQQPRLLKLSVNRALTDLFRNLNQQVAGLLAGLGVGRSDITVYDCLAEARVDGEPVLVAMVAGLQTLTLQGGFAGPLTDLSVTLRGWCAPPDQFVRDSPVLEKISASMELTPAFVRRITQGNAQAADKIRETYAHMNEIDSQIRQSRWDTMDAIAEMSYDALRDTGGYVNEQTGRIEQIPPDRVVRNRNGEYVSREEVERGIDPNQATVLREAHTEDYMRGAYGRIEF